MEMRAFPFLVIFISAISSAYPQEKGADLAPSFIESLAGRRRVSNPASVFDKHTVVEVRDLDLLNQKLKRIGTDFQSLKELKVYFIPQIHFSANLKDRTPEKIEVVARSQFQIMKTLIANPGIPLFSEGLMFDSKTDETFDIRDSILTPDDLEGMRKRFREDYLDRLQRIANRESNIRNIFPDGAPAEYRDLSENQKRVLAYVGADGVLFLLGTIHEMYPVEQPKRYAWMHEELQLQFQIPNLYFSHKDRAESFADGTINERETDALTYISFFAKKFSLKGPVFLSYGEGHFMEDYSKAHYPIRLFRNGSFEESERLAPKDDQEDLKDLLKTIDALK